MTTEDPPTPNILAFNPNRQLIRVGNHEFILDLNLAEDGTGIARVSVIEAPGNPRLICSAFKQRPEANWEFLGSWGIPAVGKNVREAVSRVGQIWLSMPW